MGSSYGYGAPFFGFGGLRLDNVSLGTVLGYSLADGAPRVQLNRERYRHTLMLGSSHSVAREHMVESACRDINAGAGVVVVTPSSETALSIMRRVPRRRLGEVELVDFGNPNPSLSLNPFDDDFVAGTLACSRHLQGMYRLVLPCVPRGLRSAFLDELVKTLLVTVAISLPRRERSFAVCRRMLEDERFRAKCLGLCDDEGILRCWTEDLEPLLLKPDYRYAAGMVVSALRKLEESTVLMGFSGGGEKSIDMADMDIAGKVLIAALPDSLSQRDTVCLRGWLMSQVGSGIGDRGDCLLRLHEDGGFSPCDDEDGCEPDTDGDAEEKRPLFVYVDQCERLTPAELNSLFIETDSSCATGLVPLVENPQEMAEQLCDGTWEAEFNYLPWKMADTLICHQVEAEDQDLVADWMQTDAGKIASIREGTALVRTYSRPILEAPKLEMLKVPARQAAQ